MLHVNGKRIKGAILDMDGVLWRHTDPLCDIPQLFKTFTDNQVKVMMATNNGLHTVDEHIEKFRLFNTKIEPWQIMTSAIATAALLKKHFPNEGPVYIAGEAALIKTLEEFGFHHSEKDAQAVVAGLTKKFTYETIKNTSLAIQKGLPFYFTNPDPTYPSPEGNIPGAGTLLAAIEAASGVKAILAGKPLPFSFEVGMKRLKTKPDETVVVGDRLTTDILGGQEAGCFTALVLSGVSTISDYEAWEPKPNLLLENISELFNQ